MPIRNSSPGFTRVKNPADRKCVVHFTGLGYKLIVVQLGLYIDRIVSGVHEWRDHESQLSVWLMDDIRLAYISTPKVASSSIRNLIRERQASILHRDYEGKSNKLRNRIDWRIKASLSPSLAQNLKDKYYVFSFVRNPLTRLYSCYRDKVIKMATRRERCGLSRFGIEFGMRFDDFVARVAAIPDDQADQHLRSLHTFLTYQGTSLVHWLGRVERLDSDWQHLTTRFGLPCPQHDRRVSGPSVSFANLPYTRKTAQIAIERYQQDIEMFGYQREADELLVSLPRA